MDVSNAIKQYLFPSFLGRFVKNQIAVQFCIVIAIATLLLFGVLKIKKGTTKEVWTIAAKIFVLYNWNFLIYSKTSRRGLQFDIQYSFQLIGQNKIIVALE